MATVAADDSGFAGVSSQQARVRVRRRPTGREGEQMASKKPQSRGSRSTSGGRTKSSSHGKSTTGGSRARTSSGRKAASSSRTAKPRKRSTRRKPTQPTSTVSRVVGAVRSANRPALVGAAAATTVLGGAALRARRGSRRIDVHGVVKQIGKISKSVGKNSKRVSKDVHRLGDDVERVGKALA